MDLDRPSAVEVVLLLVRLVEVGSVMKLEGNGEVLEDGDMTCERRGRGRGWLGCWKRVSCSVLRGGRWAMGFKRMMMLD